MSRHVGKCVWIVANWPLVSSPETEHPKVILARNTREVTSTKIANTIIIRLYDKFRFIYEDYWESLTSCMNWYSNDRRLRFFLDVVSRKYVNWATSVLSLPGYSERETANEFFFTDNKRTVFITLELFLIFLVNIIRLCTKVGYYLSVASPVGPHSFCD